MKNVHVYVCVCVCVHVQARARACVRMCAVRVSVCGRGCMVYGLGRLTNLPLHSSSYLYLGTKQCCRQSTLETDYPNRTNDLQSTSKTVDSSRELFHPHLNMETEQVVCSLRLKHTVQVRQSSPPPLPPQRNHALIHRASHHWSTFFQIHSHEQQSL